MNNKVGNQKRLAMFIDKARAVHGDKYDYSQVIYHTCKDKVRIICPEHGIFEQTPDHHINGKNGCPKCRVERIKTTVRERYGVDYISQSDGFQDKVEKTNLKKYGVRRPMQSEIIRQKSVKTSNEHWGTDYPMQSKVVIDAYRESFYKEHGVDFPFSDPDVIQKSRNTMLARYGVQNPMQDEMIHKKAVDTCIERYGVDNPARMLDFSEKCKSSSIENWSVEHPMQNSLVRDKQFASRILNGTVNTSMPEEEMYSMLCTKFGTDEVIRQYVSDLYPFHCDFYVRFLDLYIELNASWVHGGHWFDSQSQDDCDKLKMWLDRVEDGSDYYANAIHVWTGTDVIKHNIAIDNHLNYFVFWDSDLKDFKLWFDSFDDIPIF